MEQIFRIRYKKGDLEIEVESTDKTFVNSKIEELLKSQPTISDKGVSSVKPSKTKKSSRKLSPSVNNITKSFNVNLFVDRLQESEKWSSIDKRVLSKNAMVPRIMMCLYFANTFTDSEYLTSKNIDDITNVVGVKILAGNVSSTIKKKRVYFLIEGKGHNTKYKLSRAGTKEFEKIISGEEEDQ
ncbi:hypothetical protein HQ587_04905 [bacterium]|nr:hypothetical protein [bacterium]